MGPGACLGAVRIHSTASYPVTSHAHLRQLVGLAARWPLQACSPVVLVGMGRPVGVAWAGAAGSAGTTASSLCTSGSGIDPAEALAAGCWLLRW